ncbi:hypothetical protein SpCBS45565_g04976 [Spizellomyces sp. 'palustris']|nr:hypothetical protein SpCBS45565_g04976 [Spizellomyces sp. 'palustris']
MQTAQESKSALARSTSRSELPNSCPMADYWRSQEGG